MKRSGKIILGVVALSALLAEVIFYFVGDPLYGSLLVPVLVAEGLVVYKSKRPKGAKDEIN